MSELTTQTVAEEALELAQWLGTGQALLARLQEAHSWTSSVGDVLPPGQVAITGDSYRLASRLIREAVEHFGRMP